MKEKIPQTISIAEFKKLRKEGRVGKKQKGALEKSHILSVLKRVFPDHVILHGDTELQFAKDRKFRFDYAIKPLMLAVEYEGIFSEKSGHTTVTGYTNNCIKYNRAAIDGWKILRYTALNYKDLENDLRKLLNNQP